ncbi:MAG: sigma-54-dependent Fis family transcriptional regulator, partial [Deltaproteobacteria bacterium]
MAHEAVLIIDDEAAVRTGLRELLESEGYEVETAADGEIALQLLQERGFDLVLADLFLPKLDGMEILT